jgi:TonB-linked SusC/RagA family outer membrane protein
MRKVLLTALTLVLSAIVVFGQDRTITGNVTTSEDGSSLPGVNVILQGTSSGTVTDVDGNYKLNVPQEGAKLVFSFIGYQTIEAEVGNRSVIDIVLSLDVTQLSEVVVVGYGTSIKQDLTGNIASVSSEDIEMMPVTTVEQAIQGKTAGVLITSQNGKLGQAMEIRVRGASSISASNQPLYVVDGVPITSENQGSGGADTNPLADLNFNDIETIQVLKDASAAAIYGSRGANGVILITTKRGKVGKTKFDLNLQFGVSEPSNNREWINADEYVELFLESALNNDQADGYFTDIDVTNYDPFEIENHPDYPFSWAEFMIDYMDWMDADYVGNYSLNDVIRTDTDWQQEAYQDASFLQFDLSASGGTENTQYYLSATYLDQAGIVLGNYFERFGTRLNLDHKVNEAISLGLNYNIARSVNDRVGNDNLFATPIQLVAQSPLTPVSNEIGLIDNSLNPGAIYYPATIENENADRVTTVWRNFVNTYLAWNITDALNFRAEYGFDLLSQDEQWHWNSKTESRSTGGYGRSRYVGIYNYTTKGYFTWAQNFNNAHDLNVVLGMEFQEFNRKQTNAEAQQFPVDELKTLASAAEPVVSSSTLNEYAFLGYFTRISYKLNGKYLFGFTGRYDGSSRFGQNNRFGFFPSVSAGWIISEEAFLGGSEVMSFLKLRASYGNIGNAAIPNYVTYGTYTATSYNNNSALIPEQISNPELTWETTTELDIGIDFGFFNDKLSGEIDYYDKQTKDLLLDVPVPGTSGFRSQFQNIGKLENKGVEVVLNYTLRSGDFTWTTGLNYAMNNNKILELAEGQTIIPSTSSRWLNAVVVGQPIGVHWGVEYAGVDPDNGDALWYLPNGETTNNYNEANAPENRKNLGNPTPTNIYGWNNTLRFKGFDFTFNIQGVSGNKIFLGGDQYMAANARYQDNQTRDQLQRWQKPGDVTMIPQARLYTENGSQASSRALSDGTYTRIKMIALGYNFSQSVLSNIGFSSLRIYVNASNLVTITDYIGWDPEVNTDFRASNTNLGNDFYSAPQPKTYTFGIRAGF